MISSTAALFSARCPHCRSIDLRRVGTRNSLERVFYWIFRPYRCCLCGRHVFLFRWQAAVEESA